MPRATTFPIPANPQTTSTSEDSRLQVNTGSNPNLRQSFPELLSPTDVSATDTPDSSSKDNSMTHSQYGRQLPYGGSTLPDLSAMMFPSADPFAYPNQPMMDFEDVKRERAENMYSSQSQAMFLSDGSTGSGVYDNIEGQLFGPLPPYLMQGQQSIQNFDMPSHMAAGMISGLNPPDMNYHTGMTPNGDASFEGVFTGEGDEWSNMLADQRYRQ